MKEAGIRFAFAVEGFLDGEIKDSPEFVKYMVRLMGKQDGIEYEQILDYHKCTAEELELFAEPSRETASPLEVYKQGTKKHLFCVNWDKLDNGELSVWGVENDDNYQRWEFVLLPCNYVHKEFGDIGDTVHKNCTASKKA